MTRRSEDLDSRAVPRLSDGERAIWKVYARTIALTVGGLLAFGALLGAMAGVEIGVAEALKSRLGDLAIVPGFFAGLVVMGVPLGAFFAHQNQSQQQIQRHGAHGK